MTHDEMMSLLANTLADAAGHAGCLPILDCFSPHPGEEVTVSIPMCDDTVDIVLEDLDFPHEWEELLENSGADTMGDLVDYLCYCSQNNISLAISPEDEEKLYATLIDVCYENMFNSRKFAEMTSRDEMFLSRMGLEQRALFIVLPDNDTTFNFIATMLYTQLFDQLFRLADSTPEYNGALPVHVRLMMDEFANVALPKNFKNILAVCRSRNISCDIILQNIAQLKSLFKDDWEGIIGNCDTLLYLGGNEYGTYEYLSKILGKETERTKSQSIGKGSRGSSSDSLQTAGRELCMPDEIRRMRDDECLLLMRSEDPVIDKKYNLLHHPNVKYTPDAGGEPYVMPPDYMGNAATITMDAVAAATAPEITEEMYEQLDYLEKHPEENYYENEENFSQYDQGD